MSGEKTGTIEVRDQSTLFDAWLKVSRARKAREDARRRGREERETTERRDRDAREAAQRREREALERAGARLAALTNELESLRARADDMRRRTDGVALPPEPELPEVDADDTGDILRSLARMESAIAGYRSRLNEAMLAYSRTRAAAEGRDEVLDWYGSFVTEMSDTALGVSNHEALAGRHARADELRQRAFERARALMREVESRVVHVSEELRQALEAVLNASSFAEMRTGEAVLEVKVRQELERVAEEEARRRRELERLQTDRVAALMAESLVEMGYVVSNIYEAAYAENGQIIACRRDPPQTEHAVRLTIDRETREVTSNFLRIADAGGAPARTDERTARDEEAEAEWCGADGIVRFEDALEARGVKVAFRPNGARRVETVSAADVAASSPTLEEHLRAASRPAAVGRQPQARRRPAR